MVSVSPPSTTCRCLRRHGLDLAPQPIHVLRVEPSGAREQLGRVREVRRAARVDEDFDVRVLLENRSDGSRVVQVDVGHEDLPHVLEPDALPRQRGRELRDGGRRAGIDQRDAGGPVENRRGDDLGPAEEVEIDIVEP